MPRIRDARPRFRRNGARLSLLAVLAVTALRAQDGSDRNPLSRGLPDWLEARAEWRTRIEAHENAILQDEPDDEFGLSRLRIAVGGAPSRRFRFQVEGQDSRIRWRAPESQSPVAADPLDLRQAWVEIGRESAGPVRLRLGRQVMRFGDERLFGERRWNNLSPTWDAARLTLQRSADSLDLFSMSLTEPGPGFNRPFAAQGSGNVHGGYSSVRSLVRGASVEPFWFYVARPRNGPTPDFGKDAGAWTGGLRVAGETARGWDYQATWSGQRGHARETKLRGKMAVARLGYGAPAWPFESRVYTEYEYASGDKDPGDNRVDTFDNLFAGRRLHLGMMNYVGRRNVRAWETGLEARPARSVLLRMEAHAFWLASRRDALYRPDGTIAIAAPAGGAEEARVGEEVDLTMVWALSQRWELDAGAMRFFSGPFVKETRGAPVPRVLLYVAMTLRL